MGGVEIEYAGASPVIPDLIGDPEKMDSHLRGNDSSGGVGIEYAGTEAGATMRSVDDG